MKCPNCGKEMEKGRLTAGGYWIRWVPEEGVDLFNAVTVSRMSLSAKGVSAWICRECRGVLTAVLILARPRDMETPCRQAIETIQSVIL